MDVNHLAQLLYGGVTTHQYRHLLYDVGGMGTIGVTAKDDASPLSLRRRSDKEFEHAFCLTHSKCLTIGTPEGFLAHIRYALFLELVFSRTNAGGFRFCEDSRRHGSLTPRPLRGGRGLKSLYQPFHHQKSLMLSCVSELTSAVDIANGEGSSRRPKIVIHRDVATRIKSDASSLEVQAVGVRLTAGGHEDDVSIDVGQRLDGGLHAESDATLLHRLAQALGNVAVEHGQAFLEVLNDGHLGAEAVEHAGKLHADDACSDDAEFLGQGVQLQQFGGGDDARVADVGQGQ